LNKPSAKDGTEPRGDGSKARPKTDGFATLFAIKRSANQSQASRCKEGSAYALNCAGSDQLLGIDGKPTSKRGNGKTRNAAEKAFAATQQIAEGSSHKDQRAEQERVGFYYPLHIDNVSVESGL